MAILPDYTTGTITLTSGSKDFTTSGSALQSKQVRSGDMIYSPVTGLFLLIDTITGENSGTLAYDCPADAAVTDGPLRVRFQPDVSRYTAALYDVLDKLKSGNVDAFAGLVGSDGQIPVFTGAATMDLVDATDFQAASDLLAALAGVTAAADKLPYFTGVDTMDVADLKAAMRSALGLTPAAGQFLAFSDANTPSLRNILGTVSQSSGVPTGAIIEKGSNANGNYVRFADGTQICTLYNASLSYSSATRLAGTWTFPAAFADATYVIGINIIALGTLTTAAKLQAVPLQDLLTTTSARANLIGGGGNWVSGDNCAVVFSAIGRWF